MFHMSRGDAPHSSVVVKLKTNFSFFGITKCLFVNIDIFSGNIRNQYWSTNLCSWNFRASLLTPYQRDALEMGYYKQTCGCEVSHLQFGTIY